MRLVLGVLVADSKMKPILYNACKELTMESRLVAGGLWGRRTSRMRDGSNPTDDVSLSESWLVILEDWHAVHGVVRVDHDRGD